ncbi:MAG: undecaprenyldiphospho-muramoylpentapeptide beta-N-acetylglucosaminyltransferase [Alphaproteobacteria bacterium]|nr:undecaprenyldiphospho-muramoylpentapeptide beta-N-acetylglucosaminyltransferase [Alphaproteobacteria bacterium]
MNTHLSHCYVLATGGTGGHIFPAQALAAYITEKGHRAVIISDIRFKNYPQSGQYETHFIDAASPSGNLVKKLKALVALSKGYLQAKKLLKELKPKAVIGFGGYPSFPTLYAARSLGIKTIMHEQNAVLGRVNRFMIRRAHALATSFPHVGRVPSIYRHKLVYTGNPTRTEILSHKQAPLPSLNEEDTIQLLITGGSQGSSIFSTLIPAAIEQLPKEIRQRLHVTQQCRQGEIAETDAFYKRIEVNATLAPFFTNIPELLTLSHLFIGRSGASTLAELTIIGRPSLLIPLPHAMDDHQTANATYLAQSNAAWIMPQSDLTAESLARLLAGILSKPNILMDAAKQAAKLGEPLATQRLFELIAG